MKTNDINISLDENPLTQGEIPEGWCRVPLGHLCTIVTGKKDVNAEDLDGEYPFFTCAREEHRINSYSFEGESILVAGNGFFNVKYFDGRFDAYQRTYVLQNFLVSSRYLFHWVSSNLGNITQDNRGSTIQYIRLSNLTDHIVLLPPLAEQERIVAKLEELLPQVEAVKQQLERASLIMKHFRRAVLSAACSGKLTEGWREENPEKVAPIEASDYQKLSMVDLPEIPQEWSYVSLGSRSFKCQYGTSEKASDQLEGNIPILRMGNIQDGVINYSQLKFLKLSDKIKPFILEKGDFLFNRTNSPELVGKSAIFDSDEKMVFASYLIRLKFKKNEVNPKYICYWVNSETGHAWANEVKTDGVSQSNINAKKLQMMPLPLSSKQEQDEIVRRVEALFNLADSIEQRIQTARQKVEKLSQSILTKAFRGELVPTEADLARREGRSYEPAEVLLGRIRKRKESMK